MDQSVKAKMAQMGLGIGTPEKDAEGRKAEILQTLSMMPKRDILIKAGEDHMLADLTEAAVSDILEKILDRTLTSKRVLRSAIGPELLMALICKYASLLMDAMQKPILEMLLEKQSIEIFMSTLAEGGVAEKTLSGKEALDFLDGRTCPCSTCDEVRAAVAAGTHDLIVSGDTYLGLAKRETVQ